MGKKEKILEWANSLTEVQMRKVVVELTYFACEAEAVHIGDLAPYWEDTGEPLVEGQKTWAD